MPLLLLLHLLQTVMVYFSAHWCPPCRAFTPQLTRFYTSLKSKRDDFDIVFVSSDKNQAGFDEYYRDMPWLALVCIRHLVH